MHALIALHCFAGHHDLHVGRLHAVETGRLQVPGLGGRDGMVHDHVLRLRHPHRHGLQDLHHAEQGISVAGGSSESFEILWVGVDSVVSRQNGCIAGEN